MNVIKGKFYGPLFALSFICAGGLLSNAALADTEATFVLPSSQAGAPSLDPIRSSLVTLVDGLIYDRLVDQGADQTFHPHLATSWETTADGMSWTFHLREGVTFHDGEPFNAQTIAWWIPKFAGTENAYLVSAIDKVEVVDEHTVHFTMKHPDANLLYNLSSGFMGVPGPKAYDKAGTDYGVTVAVGTGPYRLESFAIGSEAVLVRNPAYNWGGALSANKGPAKIDKLTLREIADSSTAFLEFKTGGVDLVIDVPSDILAQYKTLNNATIASQSGFGIYYMPINTTVEPFTDIKVRKATALAINQQEIVDNLFGGKGHAAHNFLISSLPESKVDPKLNISYDPAQAKALLEEAGWKVGADGIRIKNGKPLSVTLVTQSDTEFKRLTEVIQAQLKAVGINAKISIFDTSSIRAEYKKGTQQLAVRSYGWNNADILDWFFSAERLGYPNVSMWKDARAEELRTKALTGSRTQEERTANFLAYHEYVLSQYPFAPVYEPEQSMVFDNKHLVLPGKIDGPQFSAQSVLDISIKE
jgi:peptide/nickel transport system substrate-binding protein